MKTVSNAHKATVLCEKTSGFRLNTDGTTKNQKKLGAVAMNDMVVSVNELPDGRAKSAIADVSRELAALRKTAHGLMRIALIGLCWFHQLQILHPRKSNLTS